MFLELLTGDYKMTNNMKTLNSDDSTSSSDQNQCILDNHVKIKQRHNRLIRSISSNSRKFKTSSVRDRSLKFWGREYERSFNGFDELSEMALNNFEQHPRHIRFFNRIKSSRNESYHSLENDNTYVNNFAFWTRDDELRQRLMKSVLTDEKKKTKTIMNFDSDSSDEDNDANQLHLFSKCERGGSKYRRNAVCKVWDRLEHNGQLAYIVNLVTDIQIENNLRLSGLY
ncbi:unnamed protein product [Didymodactylos carnosus]|uniref:Uncharacterized protein n=1 Tax=Didymodactylos carnosus TaxID=1234261 RepID=A0A813TQE9_9BILA|nr:unnamed protein product [Didymodactylos carnosus]CAF1158261.1 unnamed protein product [Didymodactylos carnosus]CAF3598795.1 unnamed protein product [Didymodactylos carnosus]CAF3969832.1 unnamed protein product [Didymodactylos carnosus]